MSGDLLCPECGGVVGATEATESTRPCTCFDALSGSTRGPNDTLVVESPVTQPKICVVCGMDTNGHRRLKDSRGYVCYRCAKEERRKERGLPSKTGPGSEIKMIRCEDCARRMPESAIIDDKGQKVCTTCFQQRKEAERAKPKKVSSGAFEKQEKKNLYILLGIFFILLVLMILSHYGKIGTP